MKYNMIDFNLNIGPAVNNNEESLILQQIDLLFDTDKAEVLGDEDFGTEYDRYLYNLNVSNAGLEEKILSDLSSLVLFDYVPQVNVLFLQGTQQDIALINIVLTKDNLKIEKTYKIS